jgi:hypothetical protein
MAITAFFALLGALLALGIDLALWIIMRNRTQDAGYYAALVSTISWGPLGKT